MKIWTVRLGWAVVTSILLVSVALMVWEPFTASRGEAPPTRSYTAEIIRDEWGVPHILGKRDVDVAFGIAIAHAEDDFFTLQDVLAMTRGRYGAIAGEEGARFDLILHLLDARGTAERRYDELDPETRAALEAYASGLNQYAAEHPGEIKLARLFPVNGQDIATGFILRQPFFFGLGNTIGPLVAGEERDPEPGRAIPTALPSGDDASLSGSNAWAIAPIRSGDGATRLVSNTHQPWRGGVAWYELVVESEEGLHFAGATFPGSPFPFLGHNETLGWTNTVNLPDMIDVYELTVDNAGENYELDGKWLPLEHMDVTLPVRFGPLVLPVWQTIYRSKHGPVIRNDDGWFAFRYGGIGEIQQLDGYRKLPKARDFAEWKQTLATERIPSTNFIYADAAGNIAFYYNAAIPERKAGVDWRGVLPGTDGSLIWQEMAPLDALPHYENPASGYLWNANNTPFYAAGPGSNLVQEDFAPELGIETKMTNRAWRAERLMREANRIDRATLERIKYDTGYENKGYVRQTLDGIAALDLSDEPELAEAQAMLARWDYDLEGASREDALALLVLRKPMGDAYNSRTLTPPRECLTFAVNHLTNYFGRLDPPLPEILRLVQGDVDLPMTGGSDSLRAMTFWDVMDDGRLSVRHGDSFLMFVEWAADGTVSSQSIVPFGSATTRPGNRHYNDQSELFARMQLKPVRFERADVMENAVRRKIVTSAQ